MALTRLVDHDERERIRTSLRETILVEAAAGTGKTSELVRRLISVLAEGHGTVQSIAALTFTEKAAGELKLRLRAGLEEARRQAIPGCERQQNLDQALAHLEEARISTIHGFCNDLLHERPVEARVDPRFTVLAESDAEALYGQAFSRWLEDQLEAPREGLRRALRRDPGRGTDDSAVDRLRFAGFTLASWRDLRTPWRRAPLAREPAIDALVLRVHGLAAQLAGCANPADGLYQDMWRARRLSADVRVTEQVKPRDYDALEASLVELHEDRQFRRPRKGHDRHYRAGVERSALLDEHRRLLDELGEFAREVNADLAALLQRELGETVERYEQLKARAGALDFVDLLLEARDLVRDQPDVRAELQRRLTHLFVDEFQDTDPLQAEILLLLASADPAVSRWRDVTPAPGKLFIVGDPKQSIYRFRRADVGIYQAVKALLRDRGAACLNLTTSFRSVPSIQGLANAAFAPLMTEDLQTLQAGYVPLTPYRPERSDQPSIVALPVPRPYGHWGVTKAEIDRSLPDAVAAFVHWLLSESGWQFTERDRPGEALPVAPRHVCLLFRRFSSWGSDVTRPYVEALEARRIPHLLVGGKAFHLREEVESLRTVLTAVEWPDDELSIYGTLKGPLFAIGDEELLEYRQRFGRLHPYRCPRAGAAEPVPDHLMPIVRTLSLLRELHRFRNRRPAEETVATLLRATRAHAAFVLRPWGEQALANITRVAELARTYEASGAISFRGFVERLRAEADREAPEAPIVEEASEGVRIMTVHRAKGLEFPVVVLADITANLAPQHAGRSVDAERGLCALRLAGCAPWDLLDQEATELARDRAEGVRVAYVAATRARDLLIVPAVGDDPPVNGWNVVADGWIGPVQAAIYPAAALRRRPIEARGCPELGDDSVLDRPDRDVPGADNVRPGRHLLGDPSSGEYSVVWWDPRRLALDVRPSFGIRRQDLVESPTDGGVDADRKRYDDWQAARELAREQGSRPSLVVEPVTEWARRASSDRGAAKPADGVASVDPAAAPIVPVDPVDLTAVTIDTVDVRAGPTYNTGVEATPGDAEDTEPLPEDRGDVAAVPSGRLDVAGVSKERVDVPIVSIDRADSGPLSKEPVSVPTIPIDRVDNATLSQEPLGDPTIPIECVDDAALASDLVDVAAVRGDRVDIAAVPGDLVDVTAVPVDLVNVAAGYRRPTGPRFGTLVHAVLATVALDAGPAEIADAVDLQARVLGAPPDEIGAARGVVTAALAHPLFDRVRAAWRAGRVRREAPVAWAAPGGSLIEGVLDLAFEDDAGWTVVDFKTEAEVGRAFERYRRQVALYAAIVAKATGRHATGILMRL